MASMTRLIPERSIKYLALLTQLFEYSHFRTSEKLFISAAFYLVFVFHCVAKIKGFIFT